MAAFIIIHISFVPRNSWSHVQIQPTLNKLFVVAPEEPFRPTEAVLGAQTPIQQNCSTGKSRFCCSFFFSSKLSPASRKRLQSSVSIA